MRAAKGIRPVTLADLRIRDKQRNVIPFVPNAVQVSYLDTIAPGWSMHTPITLRGLREDVLKARQEGMSTLIEALVFCDTANNPNTQSMIAAHDAESTERLFRIIHRYYDNLPSEKRRPLKASSRRELHFSDIDSGVYVATAGTTTIGRGATLNNLHASEYAFWPDLDVMVGLLQAVPSTGNVWRETTANGLNAYYDERQAAERLDSVFAPRFFPWFMHAEYAIEPPADWERTAEEDALAAAYGLTDAQLAWRREKVRELRAMFAQEYPANSTEAFVSQAGNAYFHRPYLMGLLPTLPDPLYVHEPGEHELRGTLTVWEEPQAGKRYVMGADVAEGLTKGKEHDYSTAHVYRCDTWAQVATYHGRPTPSDLALDLYNVGNWYCSSGPMGYVPAWLCVERNGPGGACLAKLRELGYAALYYHRESDDQDTREEDLPAGYPITTRTKPLRDQMLAQAIQEAAEGLDSVKFRSKRTVEELIRYVKLDGGGAAGEGTAHDDEVAAARLGLYLLTLTPRVLRPLARPPERTGYGHTTRGGMR